MFRGLFVCVSVCLLNTTVSPIKTDNPIEMSAMVWTRVGLKNQVGHGFFTKKGKFGGYDPANGKVYLGRKTK